MAGRATRSGRKRGRWLAPISALIALSAMLVPGTSGAAAGGAVAHAAGAYQQCPATAPVPANWADRTATSPANPLAGAQFFVDGPRHGMAAGAIAQLLGLDPTSYPDSYSWAQFQQDLIGPLASKWENTPLAHEVQMLAEIADQPEAQRLSLYSGGGGPGAVEQQTIKLLCYNAQADPGTIPIIETFFIYPNGKYCPSLQEITGNWPTFQRQIDEVAAGTADHPVLYLLELDSIGSASCLKDATSQPLKKAPTHKSAKHTGHGHKGHGHRGHRPKHHKPRHHKGKVGKSLLVRRASDPSDCSTYTTRLSAWECELRYEVDTLSALPQTVVYTEAGYKDGTGAAFAASVLNAIDISRIRGFYTNDTHNDWTVNEEQWGEQVSQMTGGAHFIVNTAENGQGPLLNPHPVKGKVGIEQLCNAPGRGTGPTDTTSIPNGATYPHADAFLWVHTPGRSSGSCNGGPPPGDFWWQRAVGLAENASNRLGP